MSVNLLPWRLQHQIRHAVQTGLLIFLGSVMLFLAVLGYYYHVEKHIKHQQQQNQWLQQQLNRIAVDDYALQYQHYQQRLNQFQLLTELRHQQRTVLIIWQLLIATLPQGIQLSALRADNQHMQIIGQARYPQLVMRWLANLQASKEIQHVMLTHINQTEDSTVHSQAVQTNFILQLYWLKNNV